MEKTYRFTLPKNKDVSIANFIIEKGEVIIDAKLEDKFQPKDGDFLVGNTGIFICKIGEKDNQLYAYAVVDNGRVCVDVEGMIWALRSNCRYATPEEKSAFLERLENECHKRWNPRTKELEDIRWRAKMRERYYFVTSACDVASYEESNLGCDNVYYNLGNYYRNVEAAQKVAEQIKEIFRNSKAE